MKKLLLILLIAVTVLSCKKRYADPTYAPNATAVKVWYKADPFYYPKAEIFIDSTARWQTFISFPVLYDNDPNKYGFANNYNAGKGTNALYMNTIYGRLPGGLTSDSGFYNVTIPKCFEFIPTTTGATEGVVNVIPQKVRLTRRDKTSFLIGISGTGTYNELSKLFEVEVIFDETEIGGSATVRRKYRFQP